MTATIDMTCSLCSKVADWRALGKNGTTYTACRDHKAQVREQAIRENK